MKSLKLKGEPVISVDDHVLVSRTTWPLTIAINEWLYEVYSVPTVTVDFAITEMIRRTSPELQNTLEGILALLYHLRKEKQEKEGNANSSKENY